MGPSLPPFQITLLSCGDFSLLGASQVISRMFDAPKSNHSFGVLYSLEFLPSAFYSVRSGLDYTVVTDGKHNFAVAFITSDEAFIATRFLENPALPAIPDSVLVGMRYFAIVVS